MHENIPDPCTEANGREPSSLSDLKLPKEATIDPYTGKSLLVKKDPAGIIIYAVGRDGVDGGGNTESHDDVGVGPVKLVKRPSSDF